HRPGNQQGMCTGADGLSDHVALFRWRPRLRRSSPPHPPVMPKRRSAPPNVADQGWLRRLLGYCLRYRTVVLLSFGAALAGMAIAALTPLIERLVLDDVIVTHREPLAPWAVLLVVAGVARFGASFVRRYFGGKLALDVQHDLRTDVF